jgi:arylsulfatase A-like enzyme
MPMVTGAAAEVRDEIFTEGTYHAAYEPQRAVRTQAWKLVRRFGDRRRPVLPNIDDSPSKEVWLRHGYADRELPALALYDLVFDPNEAANLAGRPELADVVADLDARLERWMRETGDPLLDGPVAPPPGAEVNDPDQRSASDPVTVRR